jgi:predicted RNA-binding Zn ribbon-like protein
MTDLTERPFDLDRRALCLDFLNTLADRPRGRGERLQQYADVLRFAHEAGALDTAEVDELAAEAARHPRRAAATRRAAIALRELLHRVLSSLGTGALPRRADLEELNEHLARALGQRRLGARAEVLSWEWDKTRADLDRPLWPILLSAAELLTSHDARRVRECASPTCGWMFLDRSRAARRRWCDMKSCGNRAKARRHYRRHQAMAS